jgi:hypothetical protein
LNSFYSSSLGAHDIISMEHLVRLCDRIDTYSRSIRPNTTPNPNPGVVRNQTIVNNAQRNHNRSYGINEVTNDKDDDTETPDSKEEETVNVVRTVTRLPLKNSTACQTDSRPFSQNSNPTNSQASGYSFRNQYQHQELHNPKTQTKSILCFNCKKNGHGFKDCRTPQTRIFCFRCGQEDTYSFECTCSSGNGQ